MCCFAGSDPFCGRSLHPADARPMSSEPSRLRLFTRVEFMALNKTDLHQNRSKVGVRKQIGRWRGHPALENGAPCPPGRTVPPRCASPPRVIPTALLVIHKRRGVRMALTLAALVTSPPRSVGKFKLQNCRSSVKFPLKHPQFAAPRAGGALAP